MFFEKPWARDEFSLRRQQKWVLDSLDGISWSKKMRSTQSTAFPGAKKCARLSRRRFPEPKN
ncbi:MAG: hypothetical protein UCJ13_02430, partial [Bacteroidaceae bacterium]|nr:hypothetical protein [Bacteroidaceae bacterium]